MHVAFADFIKAFNKINMLKLWSILERTGYPQPINRAVCSLHKDMKIRLDDNENKTHQFYKQKSHKSVLHLCSLQARKYMVHIQF